MNKKTITGQFHFALGKLQEQVATLLGSTELQYAAQKRQTDGRIMHAVGEAQDLIKRSLRQRQRAPM
ncbi:CsbD family protein [Herbaspirillum robiniae]|uniref:CsbD family protein n=1 Tax=Herbaspirillum robiniae TaxID=2014887 RepID=A0A246WLI6_9BURK|nr:CsbD family protein [Herbaspirillum robiniae]NUU02730.1 CsbD family protein [Herbaspirillum robiniae]OWY27169.1 CsbD family protein [Herbaspirillum robiniae]